MDRIWLRIFCCWQGENVGHGKTGQPKMYIYLVTIPKDVIIEKSTIL
jgi:hypothetical protein